MSTRRSTVPRTPRARRYINENRKSVILSSIDSSLLITISFLAVFGIMAVFSAGAPEGIKHHDNALYYSLKHIVYMVGGVIALLFTSKIDYKKWKEWSIPVAIVVTFLILATLIPGLGRTSYGASRWLTFLPIQPSELAKLACVVLVASALSDAKTLFDKKLLINVGIIGLIMLIIIAQPNLSIFLLLGLTTAAMLLAGGVNSALIWGSVVAAIPFVAYKILNTPYQLKRITGWLNPLADAQVTGYNLIQSWYAIASGGFFGVGFGASKQKLFWLPFGHTDFIFSIIAEEFGFVGCLVLIGLFIALIGRGFRISNKCSDSFGKLLAFGITFIIGVQAFINMGVATGVLPVTGVTLPLISYGGTSILVTMMMLGILLNISRKRIKRIDTDV